jgi:hypothetical protein
MIGRYLDNSRVPGSRAHKSGVTGRIPTTKRSSQFADRDDIFLNPYNINYAKVVLLHFATLDHCPTVLYDGGLAHYDARYVVDLK